MPTAIMAARAAAHVSAGIHCRRAISGRPVCARNAFNKRASTREGASRRAIPAAIARSPAVKWLSIRNRAAQASHSCRCKAESSPPGMLFQNCSQFMMCTSPDSAGKSPSGDFDPVAIYPKVALAPCAAGTVLSQSDSPVRWRHPRNPLPPDRTKRQPRGIAAVGPVLPGATPQFLRGWSVRSAGRQLPIAPARSPRLFRELARRRLYRVPGGEAPAYVQFRTDIRKACPFPGRTRTLPGAP